MLHHKNNIPRKLPLITIYSQYTPMVLRQKKEQNQKNEKLLRTLNGAVVNLGESVTELKRINRGNTTVN